MRIFGREAIVRLLLEYGADVKTKEKKGRGWTALMFAAVFGHEAVVRLLLERGSTSMRRMVMDKRRCFLTMYLQR